VTLRWYFWFKRLFKTSCHPYKTSAHIKTYHYRHFHERNFHQGRSTTEGAICTTGIWIVSVRRLVSSLIHRCVICRKLRGKFTSQQMADLQEDRIRPSQPFSFVGVNTFGPRPVAFKRTRGVHTSQKSGAL
jgi:hypothetical protein